MNIRAMMGFSVLFDGGGDEKSNIILTVKCHLPCAGMCMSGILSSLTLPKPGVPKGIAQ